MLLRFETRMSQRLHVVENRGQISHFSAQFPLKTREGLGEISEPRFQVQIYFWKGHRT